MNSDIAATPIACTLDAGGFQDRLDWIAELNRSALLSAGREGPRLILTYRQDHGDRVREMVRREQQCCAFLKFALLADQEKVTLAIEAPKAARDVLDALFSPFLTGSPSSRGYACSVNQAPK